MEANTYSLTTVFCLVLLATVLPAQDTNRTVTNADRQSQLEQWGLSQYLVLGGGSGFMTSKGRMDYEVEGHKLYLEPKMQPAIIELVGGVVDTVPARIQLVDQVVEVFYDGESQQINGKSLKSVTTEDGRFFVALRVPLVVNERPPLLEILAEADGHRLCAYRRVKWREPARRKTPYDGENYKKRLYRDDVFYLILPSGRHQVDNLKEIIEYLPEYMQEEARPYAKANRLRNREADYVELMAYLDRDY